jgi:26S proteasome regulatory subunit N7
MAPFYELICEEQGWPVDAALLESMKKENEEALKKLDERLKDAEENLGETEISDTLLARAEHFAKIGDKVKAITDFIRGALVEETETKATHSFENTSRL